MCSLFILPFISQSEYEIRRNVKERGIEEIHYVTPTFSVAILQIFLVLETAFSIDLPQKGYNLLK